MKAVRFCLDLTSIALTVLLLIWITTGWQWAAIPENCNHRDVSREIATAMAHFFSVFWLLIRASEA